MSTPSKIRTIWATELMGSEPGNFIASFDQQFIKNISHGEPLRFVAISDLEPLLEALRACAPAWLPEGVRDQPGCDRATVQPPLHKDGKYADAYVIDLAALKITKKQKVKCSQVQEKDGKKGGPNTRATK